MQINKLAIADIMATEASSRLTGGTRAQVREDALLPEDRVDSVHTSHSDLVKLVLQQKDAVADTRVAELKELYAAGKYTTRAHEVAKALLSSVLAGD